MDAVPGKLGTRTNPLRVPSLLKFAFVHFFGTIPHLKRDVFVIDNGVEKRNAAQAVQTSV
jgi:hypothetical protein